MIASVSKSSTLIACTDECLSLRVEGKALGFDLDVTTLAEVSGVSVPQSSQRISVWASAAEIDLGRRFPQASQNNSEPIATIMKVVSQRQCQFEDGAVCNQPMMFLGKSCSARFWLTKKSVSACGFIRSSTCLLSRFGVLICSIMIFARLEMQGASRCCDCGWSF